MRRDTIYCFSIMSIRLGVAFFLFFCLSFSNLKANSQTEVFIVNEEKFENNFVIFSNCIEVLEDKTNNLSINEILNGNFKNEFVSSGRNKEFPIIKSTKSTYWFRFKIKFKKDSNHKTWILENLDPHIDKVELYSISEEGNPVVRKAGYSLPFNSKEFVYKNFAYSIEPDTNERSYYIKVVSDLHNPMILKIKSLDYFLYYAFNEYCLLGIFYGILLVMAFYNLVLYISIKDRIYIYYFIYVIAAMVVTLSEDAIGFQFIWPDVPIINRIIYLISPLFLTISFTLYSRVFLKLEETLPFFDRIIKWVLLFYIIYFPIDLFVIRAQGALPGYFLPFVLIYVASWINYRKGNKAARFYILGYSFTLLSILLLILRMGSITFWSDLFTIYSFNIGLVFEIVIFSYAIGDRLKISKEEKAKAEIIVLETQAKLIDQLRQNEKLKDQVNNELEEKVIERTIEIEEQSKKIIILNTLLRKHNIKLKDEVKDISRSRVMNKAVSFEDFKKIYPDDYSCLKFIAELKWPQNEYQCRKCNNIKFCQGKEISSKRCTKCSYDESPTVNTIFHKLKFSIIKAFYILFLTSSRRNITAEELSTLLDLRRQTCLDFKRKVETALLEKKASKNAENGWSYAIIN